MLPVHRWPPKHPFSGSTRTPSAFSVSVMVRFWSRPCGKENPKPVPSGLIHDWLGAAFFPNASIKDILSTARDYSNYKEYYKATVVDSRLLGSDWVL